MTWLIIQLEKKGIGQAEICRRTGMTTSYVNALRNPQRGRNSGIGAEIVRLMKDGMGLDPRFFYDDYEGERPYEIYLLDARREEKRVEELAKSVSSMRSELASMRAELAARDAKHAQELADHAQAREDLETKLATRRRLPR